ncbi:hypothetical protein CCM_04530 [Cordyceps militaris CM01]|uniref:Uncharacterized protein n=1 Tax=Cordyceps militaris (strain CM01) TaxID=983644 RepID=G3JFG8_CORMM|nr:uncharacterized protein CCM_04530 [Cordyceps militaris CM01]EGX93158.1 hypothetical protein CCM_04530 [Cordyceps militaris CM01]
MPEPASLTIHLLCMHDKDRAAYLAACARLGGPPPFAASLTLHSGALSQLPASVRLDAIVSPANSYGRLDGAFDDAISRALAPADDYHALTRAAQAVLYAEHRGWANPGSCTRVPVPPFPPPSRPTRNVWGVRHLLLCPTMRVPESVAWDKEIVYRNPEEFGALEVDRILTLDGEIQATYEANLPKNDEPQQKTAETALHQ